MDKMIKFVGWSWFSSRMGQSLQIFWSLIVVPSGDITSNGTSKFWVFKPNSLRVLIARKELLISVSFRTFTRVLCRVKVPSRWFFSHSSNLAPSRMMVFNPVFLPFFRWFHSISWCGTVLTIVSHLFTIVADYVGLRGLPWLWSITCVVSGGSAIVA